MEHRINTGIAILLLGSLVLACSSLRPKQPLDWHVTLEVDPSVVDRGAATRRVVTILESRLNALGVSKFDVQSQGTPPNGRIVVNLPKVADRERLKKLLSSEGRLELAHVISPPSPVPVQTYESKQAAEASLDGPVPSNRRVLPYSEISEPIAGDKSSATTTARQRWVVIESPAVVDGGDLRDAEANRGYSDSEDYNIQFALGPAGAEKFGDWTSRNINEYLAVILNGEVKSVAFIKSRISDSGEINGKFSKQAAEDMALILRSGALPKVRIIEEGPNN
jgi:protein-export membrane protein SecD